MEIKLFKHKNIIPIVGVINYRKFMYNFKKTVMDYDNDDAIPKIRQLMNRFGLLHLEYTTTDNYYCFILIDAWNKTEVNA